MDSPNMKRISLYLDKKLVKKADAAKDKLGYSSRNEFFTAMIENFIADEMLKDNSPILSEKLSKQLRIYLKIMPKQFQKACLDMQLSLK